MENNNDFFYLRVEDTPFENSIKVPLSDYNSVRHLLCDYTIKSHISNKVYEYTNICKDWCTTVTQTIVSDDCYTKVWDYLDTRQEKGITLKECVSEKNIYKPLQDYGISPSLLNQIYNLNFVSMPSIGKGELLLNLFIRDCYNSKTGDIVIQDNLYEVKGVGGGLKGQKFYNTGYNVQLYWVKQFKDIINNNNLDITIPDDGGTQYNLTISKPGAFFDIGFQLVHNNVISSNELNKIFIGGIQQLCTKISNIDLTCVKMYINGIITYDFFIRRFIKCLIEYYFYIENLSDSGLIFIKPDGYIDLITYEQISTITDKYKFSLPTFSSKAGSQSSALCIRDCKK